MPWASRRRADLLQLLGDLNRTIAELDRAVEKQADAHPDVVLLRTHPGVGVISGLAFVLALGPATRFASGKQVASYFGLIPREHSSGGRQKLGPISKQGNPLVRWLLVEAAGIATRYDPELRQDYLRLGISQEPLVSQDRYLAEISSATVLDASHGCEVSVHGWFVRRLARNAPVVERTSPNLLNGRPAPLPWQGDRTSNHGRNNRIDGWLEPAVLIAERALVTCRKAFLIRTKLRCTALRFVPRSILRSGGGVKGHDERR